MQAMPFKNRCHSISIIGVGLICTRRRPILMHNLFLNSQVRLSPTYLPTFTYPSDLPTCIPITYYLPTCIPLTYPHVSVLPTYMYPSYLHVSLLPTYIPPTYMYHSYLHVSQLPTCIPPTYIHLFQVPTDLPKRIHSTYLL